MFRGCGTGSNSVSYPSTRDARSFNESNKSERQLISTEQKELIVTIKDLYVRIAGLVGPKVLSPFVRAAERMPFVGRMIEKEYEQLALDMRSSLRPYDDRLVSYTSLPERGRARDEVLEEMERLREEEDSRWEEGFVSGAVYHGDPEHVDFLNRVYAVNSQTNPLHSDLWPRVVKYESEIVSMTADMLGARVVESRGSDGGVCGVVTSGGTESIMLAVKAYRDRARKKRIRRPVIVAPSSAHAAFDKAAECFGMGIEHVPVGPDFKADVEATRRALTRDTVLLVGSAPGFPHGVIDPIEELSELARERGIGFHTDACLGGFLLPWAEELGYDVPPFDFRLPGVTSMSADTHKFGYAAKGTSVVLYRGHDLRHHQYCKYTEWPGGVYFTPTFAGSRPGALAATCWAAMVSIGRDGYTEAARRILETAAEIRDGIERIPGIRVFGDPLWVIAFGSDEVDIHSVLDHMTEKRWNLNALQFPPGAHICVTLRHTQPGVAERFVADLRDAVQVASRTFPGEKPKVALYGMAASFPDKRLVDRGLDLYLDTLYDIKRR